MVAKEECDLDLQLFKGHKNVHRERNGGGKEEEREGERQKKKQKEGETLENK